MRGSAAISPSIFSPSARRLTKRELAFVEAYVANGGKQGAAAITAGYPKASAAGTASRMVRNPVIQQAITKETLQRIGLRAASALQQIDRLSTHSKSDYVRLEASKDLLDRAGFKPPDRIDQRLDATLTVSMDLGPKALVIEGGSKT